MLTMNTITNKLSTYTITFLFRHAKPSDGISVSVTATSKPEAVNKAREDLIFYVHDNNLPFNPHTAKMIGFEVEKYYPLSPPLRGMH